MTQKTISPHPPLLLILISTLLELMVSSSAFTQEATFQTKSLTVETALKAARAALKSCRKQGYQVGVAVVDRAGLAQVVLRDRYAGAHTLEVSVNKAWTAASFRTSSRPLCRAPNQRVLSRHGRPPQTAPIGRKSAS